VANAMLRCDAAAGGVRTVVLGMQPTHAVEGLTTVMRRPITEGSQIIGEKRAPRARSTLEFFFFFLFSFLLQLSIYPTPLPVLVPSVGVTENTLRTRLRTTIVDSSTPELRLRTRFAHVNIRMD
jgi:hypothetical protein